MVITFCGHDSVQEVDKVRDWLCNALDQFQDEENITCYLGGYGGFDNLAASVVRQKQKQRPNLQAVLVIPYLDRKYDETEYDYTLYPPLESVPPRYAILRRNKWMVEQADVVIAYVTHSWGGAAKTLKYAQTKKKNLILYPDESANPSQENT